MSTIVLTSTTTEPVLSCADARGIASGSIARDLARSLKQEWRRYRKELQRCQRKSSAKAIHSFRVETRRLQSTLELLSGFLPERQLEKTQSLLKRHLDIFDDLRDTQVQLSAVCDMRRAFPIARRFQAWLQKREQRFRKKACKNIRKVKTARLRKRIAVCREIMEEQLRGSTSPKTLRVLLQTVGRAFRKTEQARASIDAHDAWTIHRTRVAFKRFRYKVEALAPHLPAITAARVNAMRHYQTLMGEIQDAEVLLRALDKFLARKQIETAAARRFRAELWRRRQRLIRTYLNGAAQLLTFWPLLGTDVVPAKANQALKLITDRR
jgi:CHAD domain-containing protein